MSRDDELVSYLLENLKGFGSVSARAMFGGHGLYRNDLIFSIVVDNILYIKADHKNRECFEKKGLSRFSYLKNGKECFLSYYNAPEDAIDDSETLKYWAQKGYEAALRARKK